MKNKLKIIIYITFILLAVFLFFSFFDKNLIKKTANEDYIYKNKKSGISEIYFSKKDSSFPAVTLKDKDSSLEFRYISSSGYGEKNKETKITTEVEGNKIKYLNVEPDTNLIYTVENKGNTIKEDIELVKKPKVIASESEAISNSISYTFEIKLTGLTYQTQPDASISNIFTDSKGATYTIPELIMKDSKGTQSKDINMHIFVKDTKDPNTLTAILTPSNEWLMSEERQYPVYIDPTFTKGSAPIAYWKFDEGASNTCSGGTNDACDGSGNGHDGAYQTGPTLISEDRCIIGKCLYFNGTNTDYIQVTDHTDFDITQAGFAYSAWIKGTSFAKDHNMIMGHSLPYMSVRSTGKLFMSMTANGAQRSVTGTTVLSVNKWYFVSASYDASGYLRVYVNGKEDAIAGPFLTPGNSAVDQYIGKYASSDAYQFTGFIDEVKIYDYERTAGQMLQEYASHLSPAGVSAQFNGNTPNDNLSDGLVGYWKMDESAANTCTGGSNDSCDSSGNVRDVLWVSGMAVTSGKFGNGLDFSGGATAYTAVTDNNDFDFTGSEDFTIASWIKRDTTNNLEVFMTKQVSTLGWEWNTTAGTDLRFWYNNSYVLTGTGALADTNWHHIVVSSKVGGLITMYVDGVQVASASAPTTDASTASSLYFGTNEAGTELLDGRMDEARVYNRAFSPAEVRALYNFAPGPVGYWDLNENTGTTSVFDKSGNGNTGTMNGSMTASDWVAGKLGSALDFDGSDDYIDTGTGINPSGYSQFTLSAWAKSDVTDINNGIVGWYDGTNGIFIQSNTSGEGFVVLAGDGFDYGGVVTNIEAWRYVTLVYDGTLSGDANRLKLYLDGTLQTLTFNGSSSVPATIPTLSSATNKIGDMGSLNRKWDGQIDDIKIYNYARTPAQIVEDMNAGHPAPGSPVGSALAHYKFDEGYGTTANNSGNAGSRLNGTTSGPSWTNSGKFAKALSFDGVNDTVNMGVGNDYFPMNTFSICSWIKTSGLGGGMSKAGIVSMTYGLIFELDGSGNFQTSMDNGTSIINSVVTKNLFDNQFHHLCLTYDGVQRHMFIDGVKRLSVATTWLGTTQWPTNAVNVGRNNNNVDYYFYGLIDEVKIYASALTEDQVKVEYNAGKSQVMGALSTASNGTTSDNSSDRSYCVPGDTSSCSAPVGEWKMDENTGTTSVYDTSGNGNTGTMTGSISASAWTNGKVGSGLDLDGTDDYITMGDPASGLLDPGYTDFTLSMWVKTTDTTGYFVSKAYGANANGDYGMGIASNKLSCENAGNSYFYRSSNSSVNTGQWIYIACVFQPGNTINVYVNGVLDQGTLNGGISSKTGNTEPFVIGTTDIARVGAGAYALDGIVDQVRYYNYARTQAQIAWEYNQGAPLAWYRFDECTGTTAYNSASNGNGDAIGSNATITIGASGGNTTAGTCATSGAWFDGATGKISSSLDFDGTDDYASITKSTAVQNIGNNGTVSAWIKYSAIDATQRAVLDLAGTGINGLVLWSNSGSDKPRIQYGNGSTTSTATAVSTFTTGTWYHIVGTWNSTQADFYVNGVLEATSTTDPSVTIGSGTTYIGSNGGTVRFHNGLLDDVRVYNYPMTATQVKTLYNNGAVNFR